MIPIWINRDLTSFSSIDTDKGDIVDITAKLIYLNDDVYELPIDDQESSPTRSSSSRPRTSA
ncbi:MAG: hypothetical protein U1E83_01375 [Methylotetracoccus sp.]